MDSKKSRKKSIEYVPEDCWILILNAVDDYRYFEYLSLVSRQFLSITNQLRRNLTITDQVIPFLPKLLCRFPNIDEINIHDFHGGNLDDLLHQISDSNIVLRSISLPKYKPLPIEGLRHIGSKMRTSLRILNCPRMWDFKDDDLVTIANMFPFLEELDISCTAAYYRTDRSSTASDAGIVHLSLHLKKLRKINLSGNFFLNDVSIISLSSNCLFLRDLGIRDCPSFTTEGVGIALRDCHRLNSISLGIHSAHFPKSFTYARNLRELDLCFRYLYFSCSSMEDEFFSDLPEANLPIKKLVLSFGHRLRTGKGISNLLYKCPSIVYFDLQAAPFLTDQNVVDMSKFLKNLTHINLGRCPTLTSSAFFAIIRSCPFLNSLLMERTNVGEIKEFDTDFVVNYQVKDLRLCGNSKMGDGFVKKIAFTCPNVQNLVLSYGYRITTKGINEVLRNCHEIRHLDISYCTSITDLNIDVQLPNMEDLQARGLNFDHKSLEIIGQRCNGLLNLDLAGCKYVCGEGVKEVVKKCRKLRSLNLMGCSRIDFGTIRSLVSSISSLRKIAPPRKFELTESEKKLFLPHTCQLDYSGDGY